MNLSRPIKWIIFIIFPVYDTYHPILGYSNYLILGITAAMAWELPTKPVYLNEALRDSVNMEQSDESDELKRKDQIVSNINYTSSNNNNNEKDAANYYYTNIPSKLNIYNKYEKKNPLDRYYNYNKGSLSNSVGSNQFGSSNKIQYYLSYADKMMKEFSQLTNKTPLDHPFSPNDFEKFASV